MVNKQYSATDLEAFMKIAANWQNNNHNLLEGVDIKGEMQQYMNSPAMNMYKKRERTQNWNHQEKKFLLDLCRKDMRIIENKRLDAGLTAVKNKAWKIIHQKFSNAFGTDRTCNRLKEQWRRMKACTRNEIIDYNNRLARFGADVADRKKPSPFTFEVWDFMNEAKKACKSEALDGIDYSKMPLALEEDFEYREDEHQQEEEHDMEDSRTPPQELCDVDIKEETNETFNDTYNDSLHNGTSGIGSGGGSGGGLGSAAERLSVSPHQRALHDSHDSEHGLRSALHSPPGHHAVAAEHNGIAPGFLQQNGGDMNFQPAFNMNNISATLEALNALRTGQFPTAAAAAAAALQNNFAAAAQQQQHHQHHQQQQQQQQQNQQQQQQQHQQHSPQIDEPAVKRPRTNSTCGSHDELQFNNTSGLSTTTAASNAAHPPAASTGCANSAELRVFMEMQSKEHMLRMKILEVQLQAAKYSRDIAEINKTLALQKLQQFASKRLS